MNRLQSWFRRLGGLLGHQRRDRELADELESHLQMHVEDNLLAGMTPDDARRNALIKLGGVEQTKESYRDRRGLPWLETLLQDLRFALRMLRKNPGFTIIAILTLALGIGATTAIFSVVYGILLRSLPYPHSDQIVALFELNSRGGEMSFADPNFNDLRSLNRSLQALAEYSVGVESISGGEHPVRAVVAAVSADFFRVIGVPPEIGRGFEAGDQERGAAPVALVSYRYWRQDLGASTDLSSFKLKIENRLYSVVGVMPPGFQYPENADVLFPRELDEINLNRTAHNWHAVGRLRDGVTLALARADIDAVAAQIMRQSGDRGNFAMHGLAVMPLQDSMTGRARPALLILMGAVGLLLLVACANVANLMLSQAFARERELAIRVALGANRGRLLRQFLTEALFLSVLAGGLGILAVSWGISALLAIAPKNLPRLDSVSVNVPVLFFSVGISLAVAVSLGISTALRAASVEPKAALGEGGRGQIGNRGVRRLSRAIAAAQLALTLPLLVSAGLLGRSLLSVLSVDPGFRTERILTMELAMPLGDDAASKVRQVTFNNTLFDQLRAIPGVSEVGAASDVPLDRGLPNGTFVELNASETPKSLEDLGKLLQQTSRAGEADFCSATEGYFLALGIPLIRGRMFDAADTESEPHVALISESLARLRWPGQDPIGHALEFGNMDGTLRLLTIVGIVRDTHEYGLETPPRPTVYVNMRQRPIGHFTVVMRADANPTSVFATARTIMRALAPDTPPQFRTFSQVYSASLGSRTFNLILVGVFATTALLLAVAGTYGVMAYSVTRRTNEIGVRMALGASAADVLSMVLGQGMRTVVMGLVIGLAGSFMLARTIQSLLFGITETDPLTFVGATLLLAVVALVACYIPARRAMCVDPMIAIRYE